MDIVNKHPDKFGAFLNFPLSDHKHAIPGTQEVRKKYADKFDGFFLPDEFKETSLGDSHFVPI
jgi:hypothetical protein